MTLARRELSEPHGAHLAAHCLFAQGDAVFLVQPLREIAEAPAHDAVDGRNGTGFDQILQRTALRVVQFCRMTRRLAVDETVRPFSVEPQDPVPNRLQRNIANLCRLASRRACPLSPRRRR